MKVVSTPDLSPQMVLQFILDPAKHRGTVDQDKWALVQFESGFIFYELSLPHQMEFVRDRPTLRLIRLLLKELPYFAQEKAGLDSLNDDSILNAPTINQFWGVPRSTVQSWEERGIPGASIPPLPFEEDRYNKHTYRYADLKRFLEHRSERSIDQSTLS